MNELSAEQKAAQIEDAVNKLEPRGYTHCFGMFFVKNGNAYDFSAADLNQIDRIERERLFIVDSDLVII